MSTNRHPAGTSVGGQWAPGSAGEVEDGLGVSRYEAELVDLAEEVGLNRGKTAVGTGDLRRAGQTWAMGTSRGLLSLHRDEDGKTSMRAFVRDHGPDGSDEAWEGVDEEVSEVVYNIDGYAEESPLVPVPGDLHGLEVSGSLYDDPEHDPFEDEERVREHFQTWAPAEVGTSRTDISEADMMRQDSTGYWRLSADSEAFERAEHFTRNYDMDRVEAAMAPALSNQERTALIDTIKTSPDEDAVDDAAADLTRDDRLHRVPYDASRPALRPIDHTSALGRLAESKARDGGKAFAYTADASGTGVGQVFSVVKNDAGRPVVLTERIEEEKP